MSKKSAILTGSIFYLAFLLLTPLGLFNDWIPPLKQTGYYSLTTVDGGDDTGYYAFLRSAFFDGDLDFINERYYSHIERFNDTGYVWSNWQLGQGILYLPFFLIAHFLAKLYSGLGYPVPADGYSVPYYMGTAIASATYLFIGLLLLSAGLKKIFSERVALTATVFVWLGSPLLYYTFIRSRMAHATEFCFSALFLLVWLHFRESEKKSHHAVMGVVLGFLCLIRLINLCYVVLYAADLLYRCWTHREKMDAAKLRSDLLCMASFFGMFLVLLLPQFVAWNQLNGFIISPYIVDTVQGQAGAASAAGSSGKFYDVFLSPRWGMLFAAPLWFLGLCGLFVQSAVPKEVRVPMIACVAGLLVILLSFVESDAYGNRYLIPATVLFGFGLGALLSWCERSRIAWSAGLALAAACVFAQYMMIVQYKVFLDYDHPRYTLEALGNVPQLLGNNFSSLLRSTNLFSLLSLERPGAWDYKDILYMGLFPLAQLLAMVAAGGLFYYFAGTARTAGFLLSPKFVPVKAAAISSALVVIVGMTAPTMSVEEIEARKSYKELLGEGDALLNHGKPEEAREKFVRASRLMPGLWKPYYKTGWTWQIQGNIPEANKNFEKTLEIYPDHADAMFAYGDGLLRMGRFEESEKYLNGALRGVPTNKHVYDSLAQAYGRQGKHEKAAELLRIAVAIDPNYGTGHANLALVYTMMKDRDRAVNHLIRAINLGVKGPVMDNLVVLYGQEVPRPGASKTPEG